MAVSTVPMASSVYRLFLQHVLQRPHSTAICHGDRTLSYTHLHVASLRIASLLGSRGVGAGDVVPILSTRGLEMVACVLAVLSLGAAWVPMEEDTWGVERVKYVLDTVDHKCVIVTTSGHSDIQDAIHVDQIRHAFDSTSIPAEPLPQPLDMDENSVAYIIFTSGTTGRPKGVIISQNSLLHYVKQGGDSNPFNMGVQPSDRVLLLFSVAFDGMYERNLDL